MGHETKTGKGTALDREYYLCITIWLWCTDVGLVLHDGLLASLANFPPRSGHTQTVGAVTKADRRNKNSLVLVFLMEDDWGGCDLCNRQYKNLTFIPQVQPGNSCCD